MFSGIVMMSSHLSVSTIAVQRALNYVLLLPSGIEILFCGLKKRYIICNKMIQVNECKTYCHCLEVLYQILYASQDMTCMVIGFEQSRHQNRCTQNNGVAVFSEDSVMEDHVNYYGILTEIVELQFLGGRRIPLFRCKWVDIFNKTRGIKTDIYGHISVNFKCLLRTDEPFVLATQASQVFFVKDNLIKGWHLVVKMQPRDTYDVPSGQSDDEGDGPVDDDGDEEDVEEEQTTIPSCGKRKN